MEKHQVLIDTDKCVGCGLCVKTCAAHNIKLKNKKASTVLTDCILCGQCTAVCPKEAVTIRGYGMPSEKKTEVRLDPQAVLDVIRFRRTIRQFQNKKIPKEVIEQILEAGRLTHTAHNKQDVSYIVLDREKDNVEQMAVRLFRIVKPIANLFSPMTRHNQIDDHFFFFKAPTVILILAEDNVNGILAAQNMEFAAEAYGLGVLFSGFFTTAANILPKIKRTIKVPKGKHVAMTLVLGYPAVRFLRSTPHKRLNVRYM